MSSRSSKKSSYKKNQSPAQKLTSLIVIFILALVVSLFGTIFSGGDDYTKVPDDFDYSQSDQLEDDGDIPDISEKGNKQDNSQTDDGKTDDGQSDDEQSDDKQSDDSKDEGKDNKQDKEQDNDKQDDSKEDEPAIDENGIYTTRDDVALYIHTYGKLPKNFMTKNEARDLGWEGGGLEDYAPGMCIGGDRFGNYEGLLPEKRGRYYTECDIGTLGKNSRGAKRIVFSNDGLIYYTDDHYESFILLYGEP